MTPANQSEHLRHRCHSGDRPSPGIDLTQVRLGEARRLLAQLITTLPRPMRRAWSCWRQHHKHRAKTNHYAKRSDCHEVLVEC